MTFVSCVANFICHGIMAVKLSVDDGAWLFIGFHYWIGDGWMD